MSLHSDISFPEAFMFYRGAEVSLEGAFPGTPRLVFSLDVMYALVLLSE